MCFPTRLPQSRYSNHFGWAAIGVRPFCANEHYWQAYFDTNRMIRNTFGKAGFPAPEYHHAVRGSLGGEAARNLKPAA